MIDRTIEFGFVSYAISVYKKVMENIKKQEPEKIGAIEQSGETCNDPNKGRFVNILV